MKTEKDRAALFMDNVNDELERALTGNDDMDSPGMELEQIKMGQYL